MYVILFIFVMVVGLLLLFLPFNIYKKWIENRVLIAIIRVIGIILCIVSVVSIYAVLSGKIVLPLIKEKSEIAKLSGFGKPTGQEHFDSIENVNTVDTNISESDNAIISQMIG